jgi:hypothetical protein
VAEAAIRQLEINWLKKMRVGIFSQIL